MHLNLGLIYLATARPERAAEVVRRGGAGSPSMQALARLVAQARSSPQVNDAPAPDEGLEVQRLREVLASVQRALAVSPAR